MSDLRTNAARAAGRPTNTPTEFRQPLDTVPDEPYLAERTKADGSTVLEEVSPPAEGNHLAQLEDIDLGESPADHDQVKVHVAWMRVMKEVREIRKDSRANMGGGGMINFRGVDSTMNVFGAAQRKHGVIVMPSHVETNYRDTKTSQGKVMRECTVIVTYTVIGPQGDSLLAMSAGESLDTGDKGTAKAMSVALRTLLLQGGMVPTEAKVDPDQQVYERGEAEVRTAASYLDEVLAEDTTSIRLRTIYTELARTGQINATVTDENMEETTMKELLTRIGQQRKAGTEQ